MHRNFSKAAAVLLILVIAWLDLSAQELKNPPRQFNAENQGVLARIAERNTAIQKLKNLSNSRTTISPGANALSFFAVPKNSGLAIGGGSADNAAREFLDDYGAAFGLYSNGSTQVKRTSTDELGMKHVRMQQLINGIPVTGGEINLHLSNNAVTAVNAKTVEVVETLNTSPSITASVAKEKALALVIKYYGNLTPQLSSPRLEVFNQGLLEGRIGATKLAWFIEAKDIALREFIWIDAHTGVVLLNFSQLTDTRVRQVHHANDPADGNFGPSFLPGVLVRSEGDGALTGPVAADANAAYDFSGDTYDYFFNQHNRDSYDGAGAPIISTVRYCPDANSCPFSNAFWNGTQMVYGSGFSLADDVDAHELTHAVTEYTANLFYYMQPGALNESYSDIFGETVDLLNSGGNDSISVRWQLGEDLPNIGAIRDMANPGNFSDPETVSDPNYVCLGPGNDKGGVHSNSGVPNRAYALMVDGFSGFPNGIGLIKAGKIQYRALSHYLTSASDFIDNYNAVNQSCQDLIGHEGISSSDCVLVNAAMEMVEMNAQNACQTSDQAANIPLCEASTDTPQIWHFEDFENYSATACASNSLPSDWCTNGANGLLGPFATSGEQSVWAYNRPTSGIISLETLLPGALPANAKMHFQHSFGFENSTTRNWDGGILELTDDGGATWVDGGPAINGGATYNGVIESFNPLGGRPGFVKDSFGYTSSRVDLASLGGSNQFGFRFRVGTDSSVDDYGWFIDDVRIYTCSSCIDDWILDAGHVGTSSIYSAVSSVTAQPDFSVNLGEDITLEANKVVLSSGFSVDGGILRVNNAGCSQAN